MVCMAAYEARGRQPRDEQWTAEAVRRLRAHLRMSQRAFAQEVNARQQTVSEWETGRYRPRGPSARLLSWIAEDAGYYAAGPRGAGSSGGDSLGADSLSAGAPEPPPGP